jgi:hypothetical protein
MPLLPPSGPVLCFLLLAAACCCLLLLLLLLRELLRLAPCNRQLLDHIY